MNETLPLQVRVVDSLQEFQAMAPKWQALLRTSESNSLFLTWEWLYHWAKQYLADHRLWILVVTDPHQNLFGIAPLYIRRMRGRPWDGCREVAFLGSEGVGSTYLDVLACRAYKEAVLACLYEYLFGQASNEWDIITLGALPAESSTLDMMHARLDEAGKVSAIVKQTCCPQMALPLSVDAYWRTLRPSLRYTLQRKRKYLERQGTVAYRQAKCGEDIDTAWNAFTALHQMRWGTRSRGGGAFRDARFCAFHGEIVPRLHNLGWLDLTLLYLNGRPLAGIYGYRHEGTYYYYLPGFDPDRAPKASPGMLLLAHCIERAIEAGCHRVDLLQGHAHYKMNWARHLTRCLSVRIYNRTWRALISHLVDSVKHGAKIVLR